MLAFQRIGNACKKEGGPSSTKLPLHGSERHGRGACLCQVLSSARRPPHFMISCVSVRQTARQRDLQHQVAGLSASRAVTALRATALKESPTRQTLSSLHKVAPSSGHSLNHGLSKTSS